MTKWINQFLENEIVNKSDKSDRFDLELKSSGLSGRPKGLLEEKLKINLRKGGDKSDRFKFEPNMSLLSLRSRRLLDENLINTPEPDISDKPDRLDPNLNLSGSLQDVLDQTSYSYSSQDFEERLAIAEYDGGQTPLHAQRIAYLDAFISVLTALPAMDSQKNWLDMRIQTALAWIEAQEYRTIN